MARPLKRLFWWGVLALFFSQANGAYKTIINLAKEGELELARAKTLEQLKTNPDNPRYLLLAGKLSTDGTKSIRYYKSLEAFSEKSPEQEEALFRLAQAHYAEGEYGLAIFYHRKGLQRYPKGDWAVLNRYWMGLSCLIWGKKKPHYLDSAEQHYTALLTSTPDDEVYQSYALEGLVQVWLAQNKKSKAMDGLRMAFEDPSSYSLPTLYLQAIRLYQGKGRQQAIQFLLKHFPHSTEGEYVRQRIAKLPKSAANSSTAPKKIAPNATKETPSTLKTKPNSKSYHLQLGLYSSPKSAQQFIANFPNTFTPPHTLQLQVKKDAGKERYRVMSQSFPSKQEAWSYGRKFLAPKNISHYIISVN
jgi:tetratricopeptide (TPR) repeat protein